MKPWNVFKTAFLFVLAVLGALLVTAMGPEGVSLGVGAMSIPYLRTASLLAVRDEVDERDNAHPMLSWFKRQMVDAAQFVYRRLRNKSGEVHMTSQDGHAQPVVRGTYEEIHAEPAWMKLFDSFTAKDFSDFADAHAAQLANDVSPRGMQAISRADAAIRRVVSALTLGDNEQRHLMVCRALQGTLTYTLEAGPVRTIDYGLNAITAPSTSWDNPAATILDDIRKAYSAFRNATTAGVGPDTIIYNPEDIVTTFLSNTQWLGMLAHSPRLAEWFNGLGSGPIDLASRVVDPLFNLRWIPIEGQYRGLNGVLADRWAKKSFTLARFGASPDDPAGCQPSWQMQYDALQVPSSEMNLEVSTPQVGDDVKAVKVVSFDNGIPIFDPELVQTWRVIA